MPGIFYLYTEAGEIIRWNKDHEIVTGFNASELPKRTILDWFAGEDKQRLGAVVPDTFEHGNLFRVKAHLIIKDGQNDAE